MTATRSPRVAADRALRDFLDLQYDRSALRWIDLRLERGPDGTWEAEATRPDQPGAAR